MSVLDLEKKIESISEQFCCLLTKTPDYRMREEMFKTYYETILLIQSMHFEHICKECKANRKTAYIFKEE